MACVQVNIATVLVDSDCTICNRSVHFIIKNGGAGKYKFLSLNSMEAKELLISFNLPDNYSDSLILIEDGKCYSHSTAVFRICRNLNRPYSWLYIFNFIPKRLRDGTYSFIAKHRHFL